MAIQVECVQCNAQLSVRDEMAGKRGKCPKCGAVMAIPAPQPVGQPATAAAGRPGRGGSSTETMPEPRTSRPAPPAPAAARGPAPATTLAQLEAQVLGAFQSDIPRLSSPLSYRLGILVAAFVMILMPLIYLGLIALVGYAVYWHAVNDVGMLQVEVRGRGYILILLAYVAPMVVGAILVLFMIKPLFARSSQDSRGRSLTRDGEPLLFAFVDRICQAVRAPRPKRIDVDCQVNASASFRRGMLSFLGNDLVLTIGMPLVAGLNMRQFGGVLAHEFGHFSQGAGMRLSYLVRSIAFWFHRVAYERDEWDDWLRDTAGSVDFRFGWILYLAMLFVWLTRKILFGLMLVGYTVAGFLLRQMEFDADRYETHFAGSDTFEATSRRMTVLNVAMHGAQADLGQFYQEGRLADNLPKLMGANVGQIPAQAMKKIQESIDQSTTGWLDTHPCDRERIASAKRANAPGIFRLDLPATQLFRDFDDVARKVTWDYYRSVIGPRIKPDEMHPVEDLLNRQERDQASYLSLKRYLQGCYHPFRSLREPEFSSAEASSGQALVELVKEGRQSTSTRAAQMKPLIKKFDDTVERQRKVEQYRALREAGVDAVPDPTLGIKGASQGATQVAQLLGDKLRDLRAQMRTHEIEGERRLFAAIRLLAHPKVVARVKDGEQQRQLAQEMTAVLTRLNATLDRRLTLDLQLARLVALCEQIQGNQEREKFVNSLLAQAEKVADLSNEIRAEYKSERYPFDHAQAGISIANFVRNEPVVDKQDLRDVYDGAEATLNKLGEISVRAAGQLATIAENVESALGLEPLPDLPDEPADAA